MNIFSEEEVINKRLSEFLKSRHVAVSLSENELVQLKAVFPELDLFKCYGFKLSDSEESCKFKTVFMRHTNSPTITNLLTKITLAFFIVTFNTKLRAATLLCGLFS